MTTKEKELKKLSEKYSKMSTEELKQRKKELEETPHVKYRMYHNDIFGVYYQYYLLKRELELRDNSLKDLALLADHSLIARQILESGFYRVIPLLTYNNDYLDLDSKWEQQFAFHPNGKCGCINLDDNCLFNIRCDHFMWAEGNLERYEPFFTKFDFNEDEPILNEKELDCVLCYGNHKGEFRMMLITYAI